MQFKRKPLCSAISLILCGGIVLSQSVAAVWAQSAPKWTCRANPAGSGWICEQSESDPNSAPVPGRQSQQRNRYPAAPPPSTNTEPVLGEPGSDPPATQVATSRAVTGTSEEMDWVPRQRMTAEQRQRLSQFCCGAFIEPERTGPDANATPEESTLTVTTNPTIGNIESGIFDIDGEFHLQLGYRTVDNLGTTYWDQNAETILFEGTIVFREPGLLLTGSSAFLDQAEGSTRIENTSYVLHESGIHGNADTLFYDSQSNLITIENAELSSCEPGSNVWFLRSNNMILDRIEGIGYADGVTLRVKDIPVFHYPFTLPFPLGKQRMSGFLAPSAGSTREGGFDLATPYYFNLAPHFDATVTPRLISNRGVMATGEIRYLAKRSMNTLNLSYLGSDKFYDENTAGIVGSDSPPTQNRWFIGYDHAGRMGNNWSTTIDYSAVSDEDYFHDLSSSGLNLSSRSHLNRLGRLSYRQENWSISAKVQRIQILDPRLNAFESQTPYDRLPQIKFVADFDAGPVRYGLDLEATAFDRNLSESNLTASQIDRGILVTSSRVTAEPYISFPVVKLWGFFIPTAKYKFASYELDNQALHTDDNPGRGIGVFSLDSGLLFDRSVSLFGQTFTQTLEPRMYYLYSEYEDQSLVPLFDTSEMNFSFSQLFRDDRFSGGDRVGDANQLTVALSSRFLDSRGRERGKIALGRVLYFQDRLVAINNPFHVNLKPRYAQDTSESAYVGEFSYNFADNWGIRGDFQWNEELQEIDEGSMQFQYKSGNNLIINLAYRYRNVFDPLEQFIVTVADRRIKQTDFSTALPLGNNWRILGRWNYDHSNSRNLESFIGVEYSNCCATVRLIGREWIDDDEFFIEDAKQRRGVFLQVTLNGLGNIVGGGVNNLLAGGIPGFRDYEYND